MARRHLGSTLILYDVTSSYLEGEQRPLSAFGYSRDGKKGHKQIVFGLLCAADGCPVAVEVFAGNTGDLKAQVAKLRKRFRLERVASVGDRGMITTARIREDLEPEGLDWISALKTVDLRRLLKEPSTQQAPLRPDELEPEQVAEVVSPAFPGERLLVCLNPRLREQRRRRRTDLLEATEQALEAIAQAVQSGRMRDRDAILRWLGRELNRYKMEKHFEVTVTAGELRWRRRRECIEAEEKLDGIYAVRTNLGTNTLGAEQAVEAYKSLSRVEAAFRSIKTAHLRVRPIYVYREQRVRGHLFLCMLAYYVQWHLRRALAPMLFEDEDRETARALRETPVQKACVSPRAQAKAASRKTFDDLPVHSFQTLMRDLATLTYNEVSLPKKPGGSATDEEERAVTFHLLARPTPVQTKALELLEVDPTGTVSM